MTMPFATPESVGLCSKRLARVDRWRDAWIEHGKLAGASTLVARRGHVVHFGASGFADRERGLPMAEDTIVRIYSMTKPITSAAILMLYEEGHFQLDDAITRFLPYFANQRVFVNGSRGKLETEPARRDITFRDLLTHTSGLTYDFMHSSLIDALYREHGVDFQTSHLSLGELVRRAASMPLLAQPGTEWNYSVATDVLGHLVEVIAGVPFDAFVRERLLRPLGMVDTDFHVPESKWERFATNYTHTREGALRVLDDARASRFQRPPPAPSGGGGLVSTHADFLRFAEMIRRKGELDGVRYLGRKTVELMTSNHLDGDMANMGQPRFSESTYEGIGFGLGFSVMLDPARAQILGTPGECAWGGAASTAFWIDPAEELVVVLFAQLMPSTLLPLRRELRVLTYQSIVD